MALIQLTQDKRAIVDDADYDELSQYKWFYSADQYAVRNNRLPNGKRTRQLMHRVINKTPDHLETDHINGDRLDNRKTNLRSVTKAQNRINRRIYKNNKSGYKGVRGSITTVMYKDKALVYKKWVASVHLNGKAVFTKYFDRKKDAVKAYNEAAKRYHGEFASLNSI